MDTNIIRYPHSKLEIFRHYYAESLIGQSNGINLKLQPEPDIHMDLTREDGSESCSCGLIYSDSPFHRYGHRNHETGLPEPVFKYLSPDVYRRGMYPDLYQDDSSEVRVNCERCAMSISFANYLAQGSAHDCWMEPFVQAHCSMENAKRMIIDQSIHFKLDYAGEFGKEIVYVTLTPTLNGLKISPASLDHTEFLVELLDSKTIVFSEEAIQNFLSIEPSSAWLQDFSENENNRANFLIGAQSYSNYRISSGGAEGLMRVIDAGAELPEGIRLSLNKQHFSRHCLKTGMTVLRIPVTQFS